MSSLLHTVLLFNVKVNIVAIDQSTNPVKLSNIVRVIQRLENLVEAIVAPSPNRVWLQRHRYSSLYHCI